MPTELDLRIAAYTAVASELEDRISNAAMESYLDDLIEDSDQLTEDQVAIYRDTMWAILNDIDDKQEQLKEQREGKRGA